MACYISSGATKTCGFAFGGVSKVYLGNFDSLSGLTYQTTGSSVGEVLTFSGDIWEFEAVEDTSSLVEALTRNGSSLYVKSTLNFQLNSPTQAKINLLNDLVQSWLFAVVLVSDGTYFMVGNTGRGIRAIDGTQLATGAAQGDPYGITVILEGGTLGYAPTVDPAAVAAAIV
jgi:hypothetical protein